MPPRQPDTFSAVNGFVYTQPRLRGAPGTLIDGRNVFCLANGRLEFAAGPSPSVASGSPRPAMNIGATWGGVSNYGTIIKFYNINFVGGNGTATIAGATLGSVSDVLAIDTGSGLVVAGVGTPGAPVLNQNPPTNGVLIGAYSLALSAIQILGNVNSESSRGTPSASVYFNNKKMRVDSWPAPPSGCVASRDKWGLYLPFRGFPTQGPWRHLIDIPMNTTVPYDFDFLDGALGHLAPLDHDPPPTCKFLFSIDNVVVVVGPGGQLNPSVPLLPAAYPPDQIVFLARGEDVTGCRGSGMSGRVALACANSLHEIIASGDDTISPIIAYPRWPAVGFASPSSWCFAYDQIFGISGQMGPITGTLDSPPQTDFAKDVKTFFRDNGFTSANSVVGFDPSTNSVIFIASSGGNSVGLPFSLDTGRWSPKYEFPGIVRTCVTVNGQLLVDISGTMYVYEGGSSPAPNPDWTYAWWDGGNGFLKTIVRLRASSETTITIQPLKDLNTTPSLPSFTSSAQHGNPKRLNLRRLTSFTLKCSATGSARKTVDPIDFESITHPLTDH